MPLARKSSPVLSVGVTSKEPDAPSKSVAEPAFGFTLAAMSFPVRNDAS